MQRLAISLADDKLSAARYDTETDVCEILNFDEDEGVDHLGMHFRVDASRGPELVHRDAATLHLHAGRDGLATSGEAIGDISVTDLLIVVLKRVAEAIGDVSVVVFLGAPDPVLRNSALRAGFQIIRFIDNVDAAIQNWQFAAPEVATAVMEVVCLSVDRNSGLTWEHRIAAKDGAFLLPTQAKTSSNCGGYSLADDGDIHTGVEAFVDWCKRTSASRCLVVTGDDATHLPPDIVLALEPLYDEGVFYADALMGAAYPAYPSRYARFDAAVQEARAAVRETDFQTAIAKYEVAKTVFGDPPSGLEQLRLSIREALLKAGSVADPGSVETYYEAALSMSADPQERAAVHAEWATFYRKSGDVHRSEDEMLLACYLDPEAYADNLSEMTSETPPTNTTQRDIAQSVGLWLSAWTMYRMLF